MYREFGPPLTRPGSQPRATKRARRWPYALLAGACASLSSLSPYGPWESAVLSVELDPAPARPVSPEEPPRVAEEPPPTPAARVASRSLLGLSETPSKGPRELDSSSKLPTSPESEPRPEADLFLGVTGKEANIRARPDPNAEILGMARMGTLLRRAPTPSGTVKCPGGWYAVAPRGFACAGASTTLDLDHPVLQLASLEADRSEPLPYRYGRTRAAAPPFYTKVPSPEEQRATEGATWGGSKQLARLWGDDPLGAPPPALLGGQTIPGRPADKVATGFGLSRSAFAFLDLFESEGRRFGLTTDFSVIPLDRVEPVEPSSFRGVVLTEEDTLPLAFVRSRSVWVYRQDEKTKALAPLRMAKFREAFHLEEEAETIGGARFFRTKTGELLREQNELIVLRNPEKMPKWASGSAPWLSVSLLRQTLVAFRGDQPVFATLVSTGVGGAADPSETQATVQGVFRIHTKHITRTMAGPEADDPYDLRDVPYVQYFHEGYALHAAFWHDGFGQPKSHGCINLSPSDARHLFHVTEPLVPSGWHSALSRRGTIIWIHP